MRCIVVSFVTALAVWLPSIATATESPPTESPPTESPPTQSSPTESIRVYRRVGQDGVVTFSDRPQADSEALDIEVTRPHPEDVERALDVNRQQREMADALAESRRATEADRARQREMELALARAEAARAAAEATAAFDDDDRYVWWPWSGHSGWWGPWRPPHDRPGRPGHDRPSKPGDHRPPPKRPPVSSPIGAPRP